MTPLRAAAALAAALTALLLQATLVGPLDRSAAVSLPAVLVAVVALSEGPGTGMSLGFTVGLLADLGSSHPAGVLAFSWLVLGILCGASADRHRRLLARALLAGLACAGAALLSAVLLAALDGGSFGGLRQVGWAALGDSVLAFVLARPVASFLRSPVLTGPVAFGARR